MPVLLFSDERPQIKFACALHGDSVPLTPATPVLNVKYIVLIVFVQVLQYITYIIQIITKRYQLLLKADKSQRSPIVLAIV